MIEDHRTMNMHEQKLRHLAWDFFSEWDCLTHVCFSFEFRSLGSRNYHPHRQRESFFVHCCDVEKMRMHCSSERCEYTIIGCMALSLLECFLQNSNFQRKSMFECTTSTKHKHEPNISGYIWFVTVTHSQTYLITHEKHFASSTFKYLQETSTKLMESDRWHWRIWNIIGKNILGNTATVRVLKERPTNHMQMFCQNN